jgi:hypothetical protein
MRDVAHIMEATGVSETEAARSEADILFLLLRERYGSRLTLEDLQAVRTGLEAIVTGAQSLRAVRLQNADGPLLPHRPDVPPAP